MLAYEKALRKVICSTVLTEETPSETKNAETLSVKEVLDFIKKRYENRKNFFDLKLNEIKIKIPFATDIFMNPFGDISIIFEEEYFENKKINFNGYYESIFYEISTENNRIKLKIFFDEIDKITGIREKQIYFTHGLIERIYKGNKSWIRKILLELKDELLEIKEYIKINKEIDCFYINTISNSFEICIFPMYFSINDISSTLLFNYRTEKNFAVNYYFEEEYFDEFLKKYKTVETSEGKFRLINASKRIEKILDRRIEESEENVELLIEFIKNLRVYKNELPDFFYN